MRLIVILALIAKHYICCGLARTSEEETASNQTDPDPNSRRTSASNDNTFDYIVVGAGAGGGVLASLLVEAGYSTLLLDAGPRYPDQPVSRSTENTEINWRFCSSNAAMDLGRDSALYPRASAIGGSALHNAMLALHPFPEFFTNLQKITGDDEFAKNKMRERFQRIEKCKYTERNNWFSDKGRGFDGFMSTSLVDLSLRTDRAFFDT